MRPAPSELRALARRDPALGAWLRRLEPFPGFPDPRSPRQRTHYDALASAIVYQQLSTQAANTIWRRASELTPGVRFPRPDEVLELADERLRGAGLSRAKVAALKDLARRIEGRELPVRSFARLDDDAIVERLVEVRGIGAWTAQMFLLFRLGRLDVLAPGDLGIQEGVRLLDGLAERPTPRAVEERAERWRPLRSVGCWMMWRLVDHARRAATAPGRGKAAR
ncbi:MAG: DNA-3-methyladenine glycosylase 2 family protein [Planctomycetes bacterium]|nr:DNA-3-methyladenine glycosylase 2 family protein [Planctomycetota bacterium]